MCRVDTITEFQNHNWLTEKIVGKSLQNGEHVLRIFRHLWLKVEWHYSLHTKFKKTFQSRFSNSKWKLLHSTWIRHESDLEFEFRNKNPYWHETFLIRRQSSLVGQLPVENIGRVYFGFFFLNIFFTLSLWKSVKATWVSRMGRHFDDHPGQGQLQEWTEHSHWFLKIWNQ